MLVSTAMDLSSVHIVKCVVATDGDVGVLQEWGNHRGGH